MLYLLGLIICFAIAVACLLFIVPFFVTVETIAGNAVALALCFYIVRITLRNAVRLL